MDQTQPPKTPRSDESQRLVTPQLTGPSANDGLVAYKISSSSAKIVATAPGQTAQEAAMQVLRSNTPPIGPVSTLVDGGNIFVGQGEGWDKFASIRRQRSTSEDLRRIQTELRDMTVKMEEKDARANTQFHKVSTELGQISTELGEFKQAHAKAEIRNKRVFEDHARALCAAKPLLYSSIVKFLVSEFCTESRNTLFAPKSRRELANEAAAAEKAEKAAKGKPAAPDLKGLTFDQMLKLLKNAGLGEKQVPNQGLFHRFLAQAPNTRHLREGTMKRFLQAAEAKQAARAQQAHSNVSDESLLGQALEIERAWVEYSFDEIDPRLVDSVPSRIIMEVMGKARTTAALTKLLNVTPFDYRTSPPDANELPRITMDQVKFHNMWHDIDDEE